MFIRYKNLFNYYKFYYDADDPTIDISLRVNSYLLNSEISDFIMMWGDSITGGSYTGSFNKAQQLCGITFVPWP